MNMLFILFQNTCPIFKTTCTILNVSVSKSYCPCYLPDTAIAFLETFTPHFSKCSLNVLSVREIHHISISNNKQKNQGTTGADFEQKNMYAIGKSFGNSLHEGVQCRKIKCKKVYIYLHFFFSDFSICLNY